MLKKRISPTRRLSREDNMERDASSVKRELIESYVGRRKAHSHGSSTVMAIGVVICAVVVVAGWALTTGRTLFAPVHPDPTITAISQSASIFQK